MRDGWSETALGSVLKLSNKKLGPHKEEPEIFAISKYDGVVLAQDYFDRRIASKSLDGYKVIGPGDWVYSTIHIDEGSIAVNHFPFRGVVSPMYTSMIWNSHLHDYRFFEFLLKSDGALIRYQENAQGTVNRRRSLSWKAFSEMTFVVPPLAEQKRIVDVVSSVDAYIDALQRQVDSARTARNAVLHELIVLPSKHRKKMEDFVFLKRGHDLPTQSRVDGEFPVIASNGTVGWHNEQIGPIPGVITGRSGTIGKVVFATGGYWPLNTTLYVTEFMGNDEKFAALTLETMRLEKFAGGSTVPSLDRKVLRSELVFAPPIEEQKRIVEIVSSMDDVIQSTEQAVVDAKNLRSGLLSDLLSGDHEIPASYDSLLGAA